MPPVVIRNVEGKIDRVYVAPELRRDSQVPIDRVLLGIADVNAMGVKEVRQLARVCKADADGSAGDPGEPAAAKQTLQVDGKIKIAAAEAFLERQQAKRRSGIAPAARIPAAVKE